MESDPKRRILDLLEQSRPCELPLMMTADKCLQLLNEMYQMGAQYANKGTGADDERAFIFFLRFVTIVVEDLPKHPCYLSMPTTERHSLDIKTLTGIATAEQLKRRIMQRCERDKEQAAQELGASSQHSAEQQAAIASTSRVASQHRVLSQPSAQLHAQEIEHLMVPDQQLCPYVRCQSVSMQPIMFQRVIIPNNIPELFLTSTEMDNSLNDGSRIRFALLYGRLVNKSVIVCQLLPCSLDTISARNFRRFVSDPETAEDLPIVGCICSSLAKACQSGFFRACQICEMVCIVCPPGCNRTILLHLVNMSPSGGSPAHPSSISSSGQPCAHQHITDSISATIVRKEQLQVNGGAALGAQHQQIRSPAPPSRGTETGGSADASKMVKKAVMEAADEQSTEPSGNNG